MKIEKEIIDMLIEKQKLQIEEYDSYDRTIEIQLLNEILERT